MGNSGSSGSSGNSGVCTGRNAPGLNQYCYTTGYDHARPNSTPDAVGESLGAAPCLSNANANNCYTQGFQDGHNSSSAQQNGHIGTSSNGYIDSSTAQKIGYTGTLSNGDRYNGGKLVAFRSSNGQSYTVRRPGPRG